jgi:hypothetical protein
MCADRRSSMRTPSALRGILFAAVLSAAALSCELSSGFLSESERSSLYSVTLSSGDLTIENGSLLSAGSALSASVSKLAGAQEAAFLDLSVEGTSVTQRLAVASATSKSAEADDASVREVSEISGSLSLTDLPADLTPGAYRLSIQLSSAEGQVLQKYSVIVFVGLSRSHVDSVSVYPPSVEPGQALFLSATLTADGEDPWIRWSRDGVAFAEGPLSAGRDRVVWTAPRSEGAYALAVEAFPSAPPEGASFEFTSSSRQEFKVMVKATAEGSSDEFADPLKFLSLLRFDGNFEDQGVRPRDEQPAPFGSPPLDIYPSIAGYQSGFGKLGGFGYVFGEKAGVRIAGLMPPQAQGKSLPFSALFRLSPEAASGFLLRFASSDGSSYVLEFGIDGGKPYASLVSGAEVSRSVAEIAASPMQAQTIVVGLEPGEERTRVVWNIEGERLEAPALPPLPLPPAGSAQLGGPGSLPGVYDAFGIMSPSAPPSYRYASIRKWKASLGEAFEDGQLPPLAQTTGTVTPSRGSVSLEGDAALHFGGSFRLEKTLLVEMDLSGDLSSIALSLERQAGEALFALNGDGEVREAKGGIVGSLPVEDGKLSFLLTPSRSGISISSHDKLVQISIEAKSAAGPYSLSVERSGAEGASSLSRVLVREASASLER